MSKTRHLLAALGAVLVVALPATPAWAHSKLQSTNPPANSTVTTALTAITLTFNEPVKQQNTTIAVNGADGVSYSDGAAQRVDNTVTQAVKALPTGVVTVVWKTVSADGDPVSGQFTFTNSFAPSPSAAPSPTEAAPTTAAAATSAAVATQPTSSDSGSGTAVWWIVGGVVGVLLIAGGALFFRRRAANS